ncbi:MAG: cell division protein ZapA [Sedimentibacter sp.]|uniref:cell division protein ZapA n=1 Tax=Sedimentibacter sp. TaxID=1960295 RepID=UPI00298207B6|nr:cell division protein ZapA [Sedimentibacter sp.]MDW5299014.1 cell division protein ZapA [Sedimentibacter sp.]
MNKVEIVIGDKKYNVKTDESPEYVKNIEIILNDQINSIASANKRFNDIDKLILSSFVVVDKYIKLTNEVTDYRKEICDEIQFLKEEKLKAVQEKEDLLGKSQEAILEKERYREKLLAKDNDREYLNSQIAKLQDKLSEQEQQLIKSEMLINELKIKNEELEDICDDLTKERENFTKEINFMNNTKSSLNGRISKLQLKLNEREQSVIQLEKTIRELKSANEDKSQKLYNINDDQQKMNLIIESKQKDIESLNNKISMLQNKINEKDDVVRNKDKSINELKNNADELKKKYENINDEKEKYLEELLMINNDKENLINSINELQEKLNRRETENFQNQLEISQLKKDNRELLELLENETSI